jgi:hypothetical protein
MSFFGTPRGLRRATATVSAPFAPHFERRIRLPTASTRVGCAA